MEKAIRRTEVRSKNVWGFMSFTRKEIYDELKMKDSTIVGMNLNDFCRITFWHPGTITNAKRLKSSGLTILKQYYPHFVVDVFDKKPKVDIPAKHYVFLAKFCKKPYYIGTNRIIFFDQEEAFIFKMCDGDVDNVKEVSSEDE